MLIYEAYNKNNGKSYIGLTTKTLESRKSQHIRSSKSGSKAHFHKAIRKHGEDAFEWSEVFRTSDVQSLYEKEKLMISLFEPWQLYNKSLGGEHSAFGMKHTDATKEACRKSSLKMWSGKRATDIWPEWLFSVCSYKVAKKFGISKTTWYRSRKSKTVKQH